MKLRKILSAIIGLAFLLSCALLIGRIYDDHTTARANAAARELAVGDGVSASRPLQELPDEPVPQNYAPEKSDLEEKEIWPPLEKNALFLLDMDLEALRSTNENVLGWIYIPDTVVDYPLMAYDDNDTGLNRAWDGSRSSVGSIFLECMNSRDFSDFNTIIYGHHIRKGSMFGTLKYYEEKEYADSHLLIYIVTDEYVRRYQVFSAYEADIESDTYRLYIDDTETRQQALEHYIGSSEIEMDLIPDAEDSILTLSTCTGMANYSVRWVVQAVLTGEFPR